MFCWRIRVDHSFRVHTLASWYEGRKSRARGNGQVLSHCAVSSAWQSLDLLPAKLHYVGHQFSGHWSGRCPQIVIGVYSSLDENLSSSLTMKSKPSQWPARSWVSRWHPDLCTAISHCSGHLGHTSLFWDPQAMLFSSLGPLYVLSPWLACRLLSDWDHRQLTIPRKTFLTSKCQECSSLEEPVLFFLIMVPKLIVIW